MIIFICGEDTFRSRQKLQELKNKFIKDVDPSSNSIVYLAGNNLTMADLSEAIGARSLFVRKRLVIIENVFANQGEKILEKFYDYLKKQVDKKEKEDDNIVIFWDETSGAKLTTNKLFKYLSGQKYAQNFKKLSNTETATWIKKEVAARGAKIKPQAILSLASMFSGDLWQLNGEINKLINHKQAQLLAESEAVINEDDIELLCRGNVDANIFAFADAISNKNKASAMKLLEQELEAGVAEQYLLTMIIRQFRILLQVKEAVQSGATARKIASQLHLHPFVVQKSLAQTNGFSLQSLKNIFSSLVEVDKKTKTGQADFKSSISLLIAKV
jgi:DNA polymerase III subunit delta